VVQLSLKERLSQQTATNELGATSFKERVRRSRLTFPPLPLSAP